MGLGIFGGLGFLWGLGLRVRALDLGCIGAV